MIDFEYILKVWLDFSTTAPLGRYLMGGTLQDAPESINIFTFFPPIFIVAKILFEGLSMALIYSSQQDTERISSPLSSNSNWFTEYLCGGFLFLGFFVLRGFPFFVHIWRQNDSLFDKKSKLFQKLDTLIVPSHALDHKTGNLLQKMIYPRLWTVFWQRSPQRVGVRLNFALTWLPIESP